MDNNFGDSNLDSYAKKFGGGGSFCKKVISCLHFPFCIVKKNFEVEFSNLKNFKKGVKCYKLLAGRNSKCDDCKCVIDEVALKKKDVIIKNIRHKGKVRDIYGYPIFDEKKDVASVILYQIDSPNAKEKRDNKIEEKFYDILHGSQGLVYRYNLEEEKFDYISESVFTILGYTLEEFMKFSMDDFYKKIHDDDIDKVKIDEKDIEHGSCFLIEFRFKKKNNEYLWVRVKTIVLCDEKGVINCIMGDMIDVTLEKTIEEEKRVLNERLLISKEKERGKNEKVSLTDKEKLVMWGLCEHPLLRDEELTSKLGIKRSTLTAIRNRLKEKNWFNLIYLPNFNKLGCQFFSFFHGKINSKNDEINFSIIKDFSNIILKNHQDSKFFGVFVSDKYVNFKRFLRQFNENNLNSLKTNTNDETFFYELDKIKLKKFSKIINKIFSLNIKDNSETYNFEEDREKLNLNEKRVLHMMVKNPEMSSSKIAKSIWISKPTVIKVRKKLLDEKFLYPLIVPNFKKLGFSFIAKLSFNFNNEIDEATFNSDDYRVILCSIGEKRVVKFMFFLDEEEYIDEINLIKENSHKKGVYFKFESELFPIQKRGKNNFDTEPFINELLFGDII